MARVRRPVVDVTEEDLQQLQPQFQVAMEVLRTWPLGRPIRELAALLVLKIIAVTSGQLKELGVYDQLDPEKRYYGVKDPFGQI
jgi:hypothetical protein